jgi:hypothetical protein
MITDMSKGYHILQDRHCKEKISFCIYSYCFLKNGSQREIVHSLAKNIVHAPCRFLLHCISYSVLFEITPRRVLPCALFWFCLVPCWAPSRWFCVAWSCGGMRSMNVALSCWLVETSAKCVHLVLLLQGKSFIFFYIKWSINNPCLIGFTSICHLKQQHPVQQMDYKILKYCNVIFYGFIS